MPQELYWLTLQPRWLNVPLTLHPGSPCHLLLILLNRGPNQCPCFIIQHEPVASSGNILMHNCWHLLSYSSTKLHASRYLLTHKVNASCYFLRFWLISLTMQRSHNTTKLRKWIPKTIAGTHAEDWILYMVQLLHWLGNGCHKVYQ